MAPVVLGGSLRDHIKGVKEFVDEGITEVPAQYIRPPDQRPSFGKNSSEEEIPVIDLAGLEDGRRAEIVAQIGRACEEWGFFQILSHGVNMEKILSAVRRFYELPVEEKKKLPSHSADAGVTYTTGFNVAPGQASDWKDGLVIRRRPGLCNGFEEAPLLLREEVLEYEDEMDKLGAVLYEAIFESLGLTSDYMKAALPGLERLVLAINFYPPCPDPSVVMGISAHSDLSSLTILLTDEVPGLQIRKDDKWVPVIPVANAIVVNVADQIEVLTNGKYKSVEHRAVTNRDRARMSLAAAIGPREDTRIGPVPALLSDKNPPVFKDFIFGEYVRNYYTNRAIYKSSLNFAGAKYN